MAHMKCKFIGLVTVMAELIRDWNRVPYGIRAKIIRLGDHPRLGEAPTEGEITITSEVLCIDFENKMIRTRNSVYYWED